MIIFDVQSAHIVSTVTLYCSIQEVGWMPTMCRELDQALTLEGQSEFSALFHMRKLMLREGRGLPQATPLVRDEGRLDSGWLPVKSSVHSPTASAIDFCVFSEVVTHIVCLP